MISVCIATYNGKKYIKEQMSSILMQLAEDDEIIVSDDGSKDGTLDVLASIDDERIKVFRNEGKSHGVVPNFENALRHATGDIIYLSDQDDIWDEKKVETCNKELEKYDLVIHNLRLIDGEGKPIKEDFDYFEYRQSAKGFWHNLKRNGYMGSCMAFRRNVLERALPFPKHILWHDMWIGLIAAKHGKTKFIDDKLLLYRRHGDNASPTSEKSGYSTLFQIKYRLQMLWYSLWRKLVAPY